MDDTVIGNIYWLVVIGASLWVLYDAKTIGVKHGQIGGFLNMGVAAWFVVCLLFGPLGLLLYLAKRGQYKLVNSRDSHSSSSDSISQLEKLAKLREDGMISEDEFNAMKKELLD